MRQPRLLAQLELPCRFADEGFDVLVRVWVDPDRSDLRTRTLGVTFSLHTLGCQQDFVDHLLGELLGFLSISYSFAELRVFRQEAHRPLAGLATHEFFELPVLQSSIHRAKVVEVLHDAIGVLEGLQWLQHVGVERLGVHLSTLFGGLDRSFFLRFVGVGQRRRFRLSHLDSALIEDLP